MGRKRQLQLGSAPKRRTVLQLDDNRGNRLSSPVPIQQGNSLGLLSHYGEDSEEEEEGVAATKPKTEIDLKVADFLAEIEALDTPTGSGSNTPREESPEDEVPAVTGTPVTTATSWDAPATQSSEEIGEWQELLDPNTNCMYFWNTVTNEVTWELPQSLQDKAEPAAEPATASAVDPVNQHNEEDIHTTEVSAAVVEVPEIDTEEVKETPSAPAFPLFGPKAPKPEIEADLSSSSSTFDEAVKRNKPDFDNSTQYEILVKGETSMLAEEKQYDIFADKSPVKEMKEADDDNDEEEEQDDAIESDEKQDESPVDGQPLEEDDEMMDEEKDSVLEFDEDDIDAQLELALEQKKAELRDLDGEKELISSEVATTQKRKPEEMTESIYSENGEINLLPFKKKRMEMLRGQKLALMEDKATQCDEQLQQHSIEYTKEKAKQKMKEEADIKCEITAITSDLRSKLGFLGMSRKDLNKFHILLIEIETRVQDWRDGILDGKHLRNKLETANWELELYEREAAPPDWTCAWDRTHKMYYYVNNSTGDSQWEYPLEALDQHKESLGSTANHALFMSKDTFNLASSVGGYNTDDKQADGQNADTQEDALEKTSTERICDEPQPNIERKTDIPPTPVEDAFIPPLPDEPPPPPEVEIPPPPPPASPPPPVPPRTPPDYDSDTEPLPPGVSPPPSPPPEDPAPPVSSEPPTQQADSASIVAKPLVRYVNPVTVVNPPVIMAPSYSAVPAAVQPTVYAQPTVTQQPPLPKQKEPLPVKTKTKKPKKVKKALANKKLPMNLVEKWKQIKEEQEKEEEVVESDEEDMETMTQRRIAEWKESQFTTGKASYNANFEMIKGDWRERLKRKNNKS